MSGNPSPQACADKLNNEIETYGNPPNFPSKEEVILLLTVHSYWCVRSLNVNFH